MVKKQSCKGTCELSNGLRLYFECIMDGGLVFSSVDVLNAGRYLTKDRILCLATYSLDEPVGYIE